MDMVSAVGARLQGIQLHPI